MENREIALLAAKVLDEKKAYSITVLDVTEQASFADYLVIATGASERQIHALTSEVDDRLAKEGVYSRDAEGRPESGWVLMDYGDIIVNVFSPEMRTKYALERVWADAKLLELPLSEEKEVK